MYLQGGMIHDVQDEEDGKVDWRCNAWRRSVSLINVKNMRTLRM